MVHNKPQSKELFDRARGKGAIRADYMLLDGGFWEPKPPLPFWKRFTEGVITARFFRPQRRQKEANLFLLSVYFGGQRLVTSIFRIITYYIYAKTEIKSYSVALFSKNIIFLCSFSLSLTIQSDSLGYSSLMQRINLAYEYKLQNLRISVNFSA